MYPESFVSLSQKYGITKSTKVVQEIFMCSVSV